MLEELRMGINILQTQDGTIVSEVSTIFQEIHQEIHEATKARLSHATTLINHKKAIVKIQDELRAWKNSQQSVENRVELMDKHMSELPTKRDLESHTRAMDETLQKIQEVSTGLTTHMDTYKLSESTPHKPASVQAGPSHTHPDRRYMFRGPSERYYESSADTREDSEQFYQSLRGGEGSDSAEVPEGSHAPPPGPNPPAPPQPGTNPPAPPPPGPNPPAPPPPGSDNRRKRRRDAKPIKLKDPKQFEGKPGDNFDTWCVSVMTFIHDQPEKFLDSGRTINWVGGFMVKYAGAWHVSWERKALSGQFPRSWTTYQNDIQLRFEDREARDEALAEMEKIRYTGWIRDMFTQIQTWNDKAQLTGAGLKKLILDRLPTKILEQMHTVDLIGRTDADIIDVITKAGRTAEKWEEAKQNLGTRIPRERTTTAKEPFWKKEERYRVRKDNSYKNKNKRNFF
jgi:hypothetical protein